MTLDLYLRTEEKRKVKHASSGQNESVTFKILWKVTAGFLFSLGNRLAHAQLILLGLRCFLLIRCLLGISFADSQFLLKVHDFSCVPLDGVPQISDHVLRFLQLQLSRLCQAIFFINKSLAIIKNKRTK
jgi:hypothetical protein